MINVTVKTVPHPEPGLLIDLWAGLVVEEILKNEKESEAVE